MAAFRYRIKQLEKLKRKGAAEEIVQPDKKAPPMAELEKSKRQLARLYDLLEQEVYDTNTFLERSKIVNERIVTLEASLKDLESEQKPPQLSPDEAIKRLRYVIDNFDTADAEEKNRLLHTVVRKIWYAKTQRMCKNKPDSDLTLSADFL